MLPPGPSLPSVVQTLALTYRPLEFFDRCVKRHGDPFTVRMIGFGDFVMVSSPALIKQVFTGDPEALAAGEANAMLEPIVGKNSVLLLDGKAHLRQRRLLLPPLHGDRMLQYTTLMAEIARDAVARMPTATPFSLHPFMQEITLQVILRAVFGLTEGAQLRELATLLTEFTRPPPMWLTFFPTQHLHWTDFPGSPYRTFVQRRDRVDVQIRALIRQRQAAPPHTGGPRTDVLSLLLEARDEEGAPMTEDELRDELMTMLIAGHETTATSLSWAFALILADGGIEARLAQELAPLLELPLDRLAAALLENDYLDAVIKESLRLRPILPDVVRRVKVPTRLGDHDIPVGAYLTPCIHLAHQRPESWPDPQRFSPDRFLQGAKLDPYSWLPFGGGIRRCLGMAFALTEMKIVLGVALLRARFTLADRRPPHYERRGITLAPSGGTRVRIRERPPQRTS